MKISHEKFAEPLKNIIHSLLLLYKTNYDFIENNKDKKNIIISSNLNNNHYKQNFSIRDFYIKFAELVKDNYFNNFKFSVIFNNLFGTNTSNFEYIKIFDKYYNKSFFIPHSEKVLNDFFQKNKYLFKNDNKQFWAKILKQKLISNSNNIYFISDLRFPKEVEIFNSLSTSFFIVLINPNNNSEINNKNFKLLKKIYFTSNSINEFIDNVKTNKILTHSEEFAVLLTLNFIFKFKNKNLNQEIKNLFNNKLIYLINDKYKNNNILNIFKTLESLIERNYKNLFFIAIRRSGKDFIIENFIEFLHKNQKHVLNDKLSL